MTARVFAIAWSDRDCFDLRRRSDRKFFDDVFSGERLRYFDSAMA